MTTLPGVPPWAAYRFVTDVVPEDERNHVHLHNLAIAGMLFDARNAYVTEAVGISWDEMARTDRTLVIRRLEIDFDSEVPAGVALKVGVRAVARSKRTITFDETVWRCVPPGVVAAARSVHLLVSTAAPGAIELPADFTERFEEFEGQPLRQAAPR